MPLGGNRIGQRVQVQRLQQVDGRDLRAVADGHGRGDKRCPACQPADPGPKARVAQVKVDPQSGVWLASSRNAKAVSSIGRNPITNSAGVLAPTTATMPANTAARP